MEFLGQGYCDAGYYAGWDDKGLDSQDACNTVCLEESQCTFAAWAAGLTCSRYSGSSCILNDDTAHVTFRKFGESNYVVLCKKYL